MFVLGIIIILLFAIYQTNGTVYTETIYGEKGRSVKLPCYHNGTRPVDRVFFQDPHSDSGYYVYLEEQIITHARDNKYRLDTSDFTVIITNISLNDTGIYKCMSTNFIDFLSETFRSTLILYGMYRL